MAFLAIEKEKTKLVNEVRSMVFAFNAMHDVGATNLSWGLCRFIFPLNLQQVCSCLSYN